MLHPDKLEKPLFTINNGKPVIFMAFSPDGKTLAMGAEYEKLKLWDFESKTFSPALKGDCDYAKSVAFLPVIDSRKMLAVGCSQGVKLWDLKTRGELPGPSPTSSGSPAAFSPDRKTLAIIEGNDIKLWDLDTQKQLVLKGHSGSVVAVTFSPDGKTLASGGYDSTVKLWNLRTGQELATFKRDWAGDFSIITSIAFSRDGSMLAVGGMDGSLRLWYAPTNENASSQQVIERVLSNAMPLKLLAAE
jgi:WD40 repeat protein